MKYRVISGYKPLGYGPMYTKGDFVDRYFGTKIRGQIDASLGQISIRRQTVLYWVIAAPERTGDHCRRKVYDTLG